MVLHFYQPPTQEIGITEAILNACYLPVLRLLNQKSGFGLTLNLSGSLLLQLQQLEANEFFDLAKKLLADGRIEMVNSAMYHPIIPLTPSDVVVRQIEKSQQLLSDIFSVNHPGGFFPPELALDPSGLDLIPGQSVVVDQSSLTVKTPIAKLGGKFLLVNNHSVCELLRSYPRELSVQIVTDLVSKNCPDGGLLVTANDVELFGHHYVERINLLADILDQKDIKLITASQAVSRFGQKAKIVSGIIPSTWQNCQKFSLWDKNDLQHEYLGLLDLAHRQTNDEDLLDRAYSSCYLYWLSNWPWWHPGLVEKGVANLVKSNSGNLTLESAARHFLDNMWQYHHSGQVEANYQKYNHSPDKNLGV